MYEELDRALGDVQQDSRGSRREREERIRQLALARPLYDAVQRVESELRNMPRNEVGDLTDYTATLVPTDFDAFFTDPIALKAWAAIDVLLPGRRSELEAKLKRARFDLADIALDPAETYRR